MEKERMKYDSRVHKMRVLCGSDTNIKRRCLKASVNKKCRGQRCKQIITTAKRIGQIDQVMVVKQKIMTKMTSDDTGERKGQMGSKLDRLKLLLDQFFLYSITVHP